MASDGIKEVIVNVSAKDFTVRCGEDFANYLETDIDLVSNGTKKIELKQFVNAFVKKSYDYYMLQKELNKLLKTINETPLK
ncbi:hypothetical protein DMB95_01150 [Campylobacter sp. MIT 12-8780]|uniref:hypothetical protein n=1 Tax=unclassified Campylobacter TaxID=2593542 RepID=UPI0010F626E0|nr:MULTISPECIES: hypothetical protein [unclassified Campylobacter]NDJ26568.1 hypothetical protein [Campylobacter sp. MIT 19-121]TKX29244.1 hypothetical protein CQA38_03960 [Campylobacter sp. MIT 12-5580]TQR43137.1 hypothetical protein DMB95_01150 [Campylobacter sp. MIT 12-8780]